jgi:hypothetical protein
MCHQQQQQTKKKPKVAYFKTITKSFNLLLEPFKFGINERFKRFERFLLTLEIRYKAGSNPNLPFFFFFSFFNFSNLENKFNTNPKVAKCFFFVLEF